MMSVMVSPGGLRIESSTMVLTAMLIIVMVPVMTWVTVSMVMVAIKVPRDDSGDGGQDGK